MKDIDLNPLSTNQRKLLQFGVVLILCLFFVGFYLFISKKNTTVYLENENLHVFNESMSFSYPDRLSMHYPYLLLIKPEEQKTQIYNLKAKKLEKEVNQIVLDYFEGKVLYTKGATTYLDEINLSILCEKGVIKSIDDVLCLTKADPNSMAGRIVNIEVKSKKITDVYASSYLITDMAIVHNMLLLGEIDPVTSKSYLVIDEKRIPVSNIVSMIYEMQGKPYFASFKSALNEEKEAHFAINGTSIVEQKDSTVILYK